MYELFTWSGMGAAVLMMGAFLTGFFGPTVRKFVKGKAGLLLHKILGTGAFLCGLVHGLIYWFYMQ